MQKCRNKVTELLVVVLFAMKRRKEMFAARDGASIMVFSDMVL